MSVASRLLRHPRAWVAARWGLGIGVVALLLLGFDGADVVNRMASASLPLVVIGVAGLVAVHVVSAAAWRFLCGQLGGLRMGWWTCLRISYAAQALGGVTPANVGGDAYRVLVVRSEGFGWNAAVWPVIVQRATSYLALALLALPALAWLAAVPHAPIAILAAGLLLCCLAGAGAIAALAAPRWLASVRVLKTRLRAPGAEAGSPNPAPPPTPPLATVVIATGLGITFHLISVLLTALLVVAVDPSAARIATLSAVVVARLSLAVPILPSGLGANEAILAVLFAGLGMAPQAALAGLLLGRVALVATTLLGAGLLMGRRPALSGYEGASPAHA